MAKKVKSKPVDDSASEPYSDELNVSSPEVLEMDEDGREIRHGRDAPDVRYSSRSLR